LTTTSKRILFFIGSLRTGGKERRLIELISWLQKRSEYVLCVVTAFDAIEYPAFFKLNILYFTLDKKPNLKDPKIFVRLFNIVRKFNPDIIHTWGSMQTFYMIPTSVLLNIPIINSQITDAPQKTRRPTVVRLINWVNFKFSKIILSNSKTGLSSYGLSYSNKKCKVIYNGFNWARIEGLPDISDCKRNFGIKTKFAIIMVGSFTENKNYSFYLDVCQHIMISRKDISFIAVGDGKFFNKQIKYANKLELKNIKFTGQITNVEEIIKACDIGLLFSTDGEGISNSIMEYMALGKPVIANNSGGTNEIVSNNKSGYLITNETSKEVAAKVIYLLDNPELRHKLGSEGLTILRNKFSLIQMGNAFDNLYSKFI